MIKNQIKMNKAEEYAIERYPKVGLYDNIKKREGFIEGYHQAEKDLELTWEDIGAIDKLLWDLSTEHSGKSDNKMYYEEVLKRFKNLKK